LYRSNSFRPVSTPNTLTVAVSETSVAVFFSAWIFASICRYSSVPWVSVARRASQNLISSARRAWYVARSLSSVEAFILLLTWNAWAARAVAASSLAGSVIPAVVADRALPSCRTLAAASVCPMRSRFLASASS